MIVQMQDSSFLRNGKKWKRVSVSSLWVIHLNFVCVCSEEQLVWRELLMK